MPISDRIRSEAFSFMTAWSHTDRPLQPDADPQISGCRNAVGARQDTFEPGLAWLAFLHVSRPFRRRGAATASWNEATQLDEDAGSDSVSAIPTGSAVGFYLSRGCTLTRTP